MNDLVFKWMHVALFSVLGSVVAAAERGDAGPFVDVGAELGSHREIESLTIPFQTLGCLRLRPDGLLLACDVTANEIKVISSAGKQVGAWKLGFGPDTLDVAADNTVYCGGQGQLAKLDQDGRVLKTVPIPDTADSPISEVSRRRAKMSHVSLRLRVSGIAVTDRDLFVTFGSGWSLVSTSKLYRFDRDLANAQLLVDGLRGCCQRCDIVCRDGILYVAENSAHRVVRYDRDGNTLGKWGERSRTELAGFGSCCNPMNICFDAEGVLYTAESGIGRVKRYSPDGKFLGLVGYVGVQRFRKAGPQAASCSNMAIAVTPDGASVYVMDYKKNTIRVLQRKP